jgi:poly(3-hydroxybutyrate) depolymerase
MTSYRIHKRRLRGQNAGRYQLYRPSGDTAGAPVLVLIHGISRNVDELIQAFMPLAERYGVVLVAPLFSEREMPAYQRLGYRRDIRLSEPDAVLHSILQEVALQTGAWTERVYLFGYSGGGQFVHRYAMAYPARVRAVVLGAPGWYTFPDHDTAFPRGLHTGEALPLRLEPTQFLRIPMAVFVGSEDDQRDVALNTQTAVDRRQGRNRIERGRRWLAAMQAAAAGCGYPTRYEFRLLPGCGHSFTACAEHGELADQTFRFLLSSPSPVLVKQTATRRSPFVLFQFA